MRNQHPLPVQRRPLPPHGRHRTNGKRQIEPRAPDGARGRPQRRRRRHHRRARGGRALPAHVRARRAHRRRGHHRPHEHAHAAEHEPARRRPRRPRRRVQSGERLHRAAEGPEPSRVGWPAIRPDGTPRPRDDARPRLPHTPERRLHVRTAHRACRAHVHELGVRRVLPGKARKRAPPRTVEARDENTHVTRSGRQGAVVFEQARPVQQRPRAEKHLRPRQEDGRRKANRRRGEDSGRGHPRAPHRPRCRRSIAHVAVHAVERCDLAAWRRLEAGCEASRGRGRRRR